MFCINIKAEFIFVCVLTVHSLYSMNTEAKTTKNSKDNE